MQMTPVYWLILGIVLFILEVTAPGLVSMFFGLSALTVALIVWLCPLPQGVQWMVFAAFSVIYILLLRNAMKKVFKGKKEVSESMDDSFTGRLAAVVEAVAPNKPGRVAFNGCDWTAEADAEIPAGRSVRILGKKNLTLKVEEV